MGSEYLILLEEDISVDPRKYGPIVAPAMGVTVIEARMAIRKGRGILLDRIPEEHALRISEELKKDSIESHVISREQFPPFASPRRTVHLTRDEEVFSYMADAPGTIPWNDLLVVSLGVVAREGHAPAFSHVDFKSLPPMHRLEGSERELVRENLILKMEALPPEEGRKKKRDTRSTIFEEIERAHGRKVQIIADVVSSDLDCWLRIPMDEVAYAHNETSVKMGGAWAMDMFVRDLLRHRPEALTASSLQLLDGVDIKRIIFLQPEDFSRYTSWIALKRFLWPKEDSSSPSPALPEPSTGDDSSSASPEPGPSST